MALERELEAFYKALPGLLSQGDEGKYVLIRGDQVVGTYDTHEQALAAGYAAFLPDPFLVKKIEEVEKPRYFSGSIRPCHT